MAVPRFLVNPGNVISFVPELVVKSLEKRIRPVKIGIRSFQNGLHETLSTVRDYSHRPSRRHRRWRAALSGAQAASTAGETCLWNTRSRTAACSWPCERSRRIRGVRRF